jgi:hypothetical protein
MDASPDCPRGFNRAAIGSTLLLYILVLLYAWLSPTGLNILLARDDSPLIELYSAEKLTTIALIPAFLSGFYACYRYRKSMPIPLWCWVFIWSLVCFYFAGEEESWGQWYFRWGTPEYLNMINKQHETNLHNVSPWLNQTPRALIELFIIATGFLVPLWRSLGNKGPIIRRGFLTTWENWIYAPTALLPAGIMVLVSKIAYWMPQPSEAIMGVAEMRELLIAWFLISNGEIVEMSIAWFLMWYLISYLVRLRHPGSRECSPNITSP